MKSKSENNREAPILALVVPCYNEDAILPTTMSVLSAMLDKCKKNGLVHKESFALYVDDGSKDKTWQLIEEFHKNDFFCRGISFAANAGHQNAVWAGMETARKWGADCIISLDADLQDDIDVIPEMLNKYFDGCDIVYGVRGDRSTDTSFKRSTAHFFYSLMGWLHVRLIPDHADYRLVSAPVLDILPSIGEQNLFLRGLFPTLGFQTDKVYYSRKSREAGESKYPLYKMISFAWQGITSCSVAPLRLAGVLGFITMIVALVYSLVVLSKYLAGEVIQGWTSMVIVVLLLGSAQLFCLSVMGEYIAKIFSEVRHRPRYIVEKTV